MGINIGINNILKPKDLHAKKPTHHSSLIEYWDFSKYKNSDFTQQVNKIEGIKGVSLELRDFLYKADSGFGLYKVDYSIYSNIDETVATLTNDSIKIKGVPQEQELYFNSPKNQKQESYKIFVSGVSKTNYIVYTYYKNDKLNELIIDKSGYYQLPESINKGNNNSIIFRRLNDNYNNIVIRQIASSYDGALIFSGASQAVSYNTDIIKTVIIKMLFVDKQSNIEYPLIFFRTLPDDINIAYDSRNKVIKSFGNTKINDISTCLIAQLPNPIITGNRVFICDTIGLLKIAVYGVALYKDLLTDEEIQKEIDLIDPIPEGYNNAVLVPINNNFSDFDIADVIRTKDIRIGFIYNDKTKIIRSFEISVFPTNVGNNETIVKINNRDYLVNYNVSITTFVDEGYVPPKTVYKLNEPFDISELVIYADCQLSPTYTERILIDNRDIQVIGFNNSVVGEKQVWLRYRNTNKVIKCYVTNLVDSNENVIVDKNNKILYL